MTAIDRLSVRREIIIFTYIMHSVTVDCHGRMSRKSHKARKETRNNSYGAQATGTIALLLRTYEITQNGAARSICCQSH